MRLILIILTGLAALISGFSANAQKREVPYWASMKFETVNMRVGPGKDFKIDWVYKRKGLPVKVVRAREGWRLLQDPDGAQGWVNESQLLLTRMALVKGEGLTAIRAAPNASAAIKWNAQSGVVGKLGDCDMGWCEFDVEGRVGWVRENRLWGTGAP